MARVRQIKPSFFVDEDCASLSMAARMMFIGMWTCADREGRLEDKPRTIKIQTLPFDDVDPNALLSELAKAGIIVRYEAAGRDYISIRSFAKHQKPHPKEAESTFPPPPSSGPEPTKPVPGKDEPCNYTAEPGEILSSSADSYSESESNPNEGGEKISPRLALAHFLPDEPEAITVTERPNDVWSAENWLRKFKLAYDARGIQGATAFYGFTSDTKALATLSGELARLPLAVKLSTQARSAQMFARFFLPDPKKKERLYPFIFFVQEFGELRAATAKDIAAAPVRQPEGATPYHLKPRNPPAPKVANGDS